MTRKRLYTFWQVLATNAFVAVAVFVIARAS